MCLKFCIKPFSDMSRFERAQKPHDVTPTLWMFVGLTVLVGSIIGKNLVSTDILVQFIK